MKIIKYFYNLSIKLCNIFKKLFLYKFANKIVLLLVVSVIIVNIISCFILSHIKYN